MQHASDIRMPSPRNRGVIQRLEAFKQWSSWSKLILFISMSATLAVFILAPNLCPRTESNSMEFLLCWFHWLATVALISTVLWSIFAFFGVYVGPHALWKHTNEFGPWVFAGAGLVYLFGIFVYIFAI